MPYAPRFVRPALAALALGAVGNMRADTEGAKGSPFLPPPSNGTQLSGAQAETIEFAGVMGEGKQLVVNVYDKTSRHGRWIPVGGTVDGYTVTAYDPLRDQIVVKVADQQKILTLRKASGPTAAPAVSLQNMNFNLPPPAPVPAVATSGSETLAAPAPAAAEPAAAKPAAPAAPTTIARQEEEARMLVSDLLEIGMAQRKAYEEAAQKKAAGQSNPSTPAPAAAPPATGG
jgi:hypothetical protein